MDLEAVIKIYEKKLDEGITLFELIELNKKSHFSLKISSTKYGFVLFLRSDYDFFTEKQVGVNILPGKSIKMDLRKLGINQKENNDVLKYFKSNEKRIVLKYFEFKDTGVSCFRYYLKKITKG